MNPDSNRHLGLFATTGVGVGAIVGGGILALAGAAFATTGPSAIVAFALNGIVAVLTALSFAEVSSKFPESGGTYVFAKKVLSVETAFTVGWVVWFASIVAAVLYAMGFAQFAIVAARDVWAVVSSQPAAWLESHGCVVAVAALATTVYAVALIQNAHGGAAWTNVGKLAVFGVLILGGLWALAGRSPSSVRQALQPFFAEGPAGLFQAMGFTFIALQGFDLIAAVAGEVRTPERTIPRAMLISLGLALLVYLSLLFVIATVGVPEGESITELSRRAPETAIAVAAQNYLGRFGYWLVIVAAMLSMLSALQANLFAASRVAMAMSRDHTLPAKLAKLDKKRKTPANAIALTAVIVLAILIVLPDVLAAGAASSLIFLITFALAHWIAILVRQRTTQRPPPFRAPLFPLVPVLGGTACFALAVYQGVVVPTAGLIALVWLVAGGVLFLALFARRAQLADVSSSALDPELIQLRARSPLVLLPLANPENARGLVAVAHALAPPDVGRVLLLSVIVAPRDWHPDSDPGPLAKSQQVLGAALTASVEAGLFPDALATIAPEPWPEIARVADAHRCESVLLGLSHLSDDYNLPIDVTLNEVRCDIVVLRAPQAWSLAHVQRILVPLAGSGVHEQVLARLLASLSRMQGREITFLNVVPQETHPDDLRKVQRRFRRIARDIWPGQSETRVITSDHAAATVAAQAASYDLVILGSQRLGRGRKSFGTFAHQVATTTATPLLLISRRG